MKPSELIGKVEAYFENPNHFTQGAWGKDAKGNTLGFDELQEIARGTDARRRSVNCMCTKGALGYFAAETVTRWEDEDEADICLQRAILEVPSPFAYISVTTFNDNSQLEDIRGVLKRARELALANNR